MAIDIPLLQTILNSKYIRQKFTYADFPTSTI
jgi:hypothetical protein